MVVCVWQIWSSFHCVLHASIDVGSYVYSLKISFDGRSLAATCKDRSLKIYDLQDPEGVLKGVPTQVSLSLSRSLSPLSQL